MRLALLADPGAVARRSQPSAGLCPASQAPPARGGVGRSVGRTDGRTEAAAVPRSLPARPGSAPRPLPPGGCRGHGGAGQAAEEAVEGRREPLPRPGAGEGQLARGDQTGVPVGRARGGYGPRCSVPLRSGAAVAPGNGPCRSAPRPRVPAGSWRCATTPIRTPTIRRRPNASRRSTALTPRSATPTGGGCTISTGLWASTWPSSSETMPSGITSSCPNGGSRWASGTAGLRGGREGNGRGGRGGLGGPTVAFGDLRAAGQWGAQGGPRGLSEAPGVSGQPWGLTVPGSGGSGWLWGIMVPIGVLQWSWGSQGSWTLKSQ